MGNVIDKITVSATNPLATPPATTTNPASVRERGEMSITRDEVELHITSLVIPETIRLLRTLLAERDAMRMAIGELEYIVRKALLERAAANLARLMGEGNG